MLRSATPSRGRERAEGREQRHHDREQREARDRLDHARDAEHAAPRGARRRVTATPSGTLTAAARASATSVSWRWAVRYAGQQRELLAHGAPPSREQRVDRRGLPARRREELRARSRSPAARSSSARRAELHEPARAQHRDPVAEQQRLGHVVGDEDHGEAELARGCAGTTAAGDRASPDRARRTARRAAAARAPRRERAREADALLLPARELVRPALAELVRRRARRARAARRRARARAPRPSRGARGVTPTFSPTREVREQADLLEGVADARGAARAARSRARRRLSTSTLPASGSTSRLTIFSVVVLPLPEPPSSTRHSPRATSSETPSTTAARSVVLADRSKLDRAGPLTRPRYHAESARALVRSRAEDPRCPKAPCTASSASSSRPTR